MEEKENKTIVQTSLLPFNQQFETLELEKCKTIREIVNKLIPFNFQDCKLVVTLNNEVVDSDDYDKIELKKSDIVGINFVPMGGGNNKGLQIAIMVGVVLASAWLAPLAVSALSLQAGSLGAAFVTGAVYTGVGMLGQLAMNALISTPKQNKGTGKDAETFFIDSARNEISKYGAIPVNLGTNRMFPKQAATPYIESSFDNNYVRQLFTYGYGKLLVLERKFGETKIESFTEVEFEDRLNADLNKGTSIFSRSVKEESLNIELKQETGFVTRTTILDCSEVEFDITFPSGLVRYDDDGSKKTLTVEFESQWRKSGTSKWSSDNNGTSVLTDQDVYVDLSSTFHATRKKKKKWRCDDTWLILDLNSGVVSSEKTDRWYYTPANPPYTSLYWVGSPLRGHYETTKPDYYNKLILGYIDGNTHVFTDYTKTLAEQGWINKGGFNIVYDVPPRPVPNRNGGYRPEYANYKIVIGKGNILKSSGNIIITASTNSAIRRSKRFKFPTPGEYEIRVRRVTEDWSDKNTYVANSYLTALRFFREVQPVKFADISGSALRIKATSQLNGAVDSYNCIVSTYLKGYNPVLKTWVNDVISSNPADIFRYVLQSPAFAKHVSDDKIDLKKLEEWWVYCNSLDLTYDRIIDYDTSIDDVLNDICAAGVATLCKVNNVYSVIIDNERPMVKGLITPRNSWDYSGNINYPEIPHALRIEFRNDERGYETDERIVYADGYNESNATLYERLQFASCTDPDLAYWYGRRYFATALLQPETHTFKMDFEHMTFNRGDRISLVNDVILVGVGQGRIKELLVDNVDNPTSVLGFTIDDELDIPPAVNLGTRIRDNNAKQGYKYHLLQPIEGRTGQFVFKTPIPYNEAPAIGSLCAFVEDGKELDLIITGIKADKNQAATITAIDYAPARFDPIGEIPPFESNITLGLDFYKPKAPILMSEIQTDESVMVRNSDGSLISVAVIPLINKNEDNMGVIVRARLKGATEWFTPGTLKKDPNQVILTGLQDGDYYDFEIIYQRQTGLQLLSDPLMIENVKFIGGSNPPHKVRNFRVTVTNGLGFFEWSPNNDIDISHYEIRFSYETEGATWENSQVAMNKITASSVTNIIHEGIYLIKAVDLLGNESVEATTIISTDSGAFNNVVEELIQDPTWDGVKDNVINEVGILAIDDDTKTDGYYYFNPDIVDLGDNYECSVTANVRSVVEKRSRIRDIDETTNGIRGLGPIRDFGAGWNTNVDWFVRLEMNVSNDGETWSGWQEFIASQLKFRAIKFRLHLHSDNVYITPRVSIARVIIDMPDRYESKEDVMMEDANVGAVVTYNQAFWNNPAVNITVQDGDVDDRIEFITKNNKGFTFKVFNATLNAYVKRSFDYLAAGYGRVVK